MNPAKLKIYWDKLLALMRVRSVLSGLEISDSVLRLVRFEGGAWKREAVRLAAGVMEAGRVRNYEAFVSALRELKVKALGVGGSKRINAIVSLSSMNIYSQVFGLPIIEGENLEKAIQLNLQMVSPMEPSQAYFGWQLVGEDKDSLRLEILSAFIERSAADELSKALYEAGFLIVALEMKALGLARVLREMGEGIDKEKVYVLANVDNSGIDFLVIRRGQLYFEYFNSWRDIVGDGGQISLEVFRAAVSRNLHQVMNFYGQHWPEPVSGVFISASALGEEVATAIKENFSLPAWPILLRGGEGAEPEWFVALGCALRGQKPRSEDEELSLLGLTASEEFHRERFLEFVRFWRLALPAALGFLLALLLVSELYILETKKNLESQSLFQLGAEQAKENQILQAQAAEFNRLVGTIKSVRAGYLPKSMLIEKFGTLASASSITLDKIIFPSLDKPITLNGTARAEEGIVRFKQALQGEPGFSEVDLPLTSIQASGGGFSFSVSFQLKR